MPGMTMWPKQWYTKASMLPSSPPAIKPARWLLKACVKPSAVIMHSTRDGERKFAAEVQE